MSFKPGQSWLAKNLRLTVRKGTKVSAINPPGLSGSMPGGKTVVN